MSGNKPHLEFYDLTGIQFSFHIQITLESSFEVIYFSIRFSEREQWPVSICYSFMARGGLYVLRVRF